MGIKPFKFICALLVLFTGFMGNVCAQESSTDKHVLVSLRTIGHRLLLEAGDSTSRVLPITNKEGSYRIRFETEFELQPEGLVQIANEVISESGLAGGYFMEVIDCDSQMVVYSYERGIVSNNTQAPCMGRALPKDCYELLFTLQKPLMVGIYPISESSKTKAEQSLAPNFLLLLMAFLVIILFVIAIKRRKKRNSIQAHIKPIGNFHFDQHKALLILREQQIELSSKEADLLSVLYSSVNKTVERDVILNLVWGDEGDYVGRTLDVFVSKLRKKLEADATVKIMNIRGVGYKLVVG